MSKNRTDPGTPSEEFETMESVRKLPRMLDSSRANGGINLLLANPGGRLFRSSVSGKRLLSTGEVMGDGKTPETRLVDTASPEFVGNRPLLIQHEAEGDQDYRFRASIAAPRNGFWHSVESLAGKPFRQPLQIKGAPDVLSSDGEWVKNADLRGNSLRSVASRMARCSAGYGIGYWWVDYSQRHRRPFVRAIPEDTVTRVHFESEDRRRIHVRMAQAEYEKPEDAEDPSKFPGRKHLVLVFRDGDPDATEGDEQWASYEVYDAEDDEGEKFRSAPSKVESADGKMVTRVSLAPNRRIPFVPVPTGEMTSSHLILPPLLEAAQLDYLLLQVTSNTEYSTIVANTFIRFAKGLNKEDVDEWSTLGPQFFYATTSVDADMKWVTLGGEALKAGVDLATFLMRALEVAGLAPMLTRSPGDERATGQAIASARATSVAEAFYLQWQSAISKVLNLMRLHVKAGSSESSADAEITAQVSHDLGLDGQAIDQGQLLTKLYLDPKKDFSSIAFWSEMRRIGIVSEDVDIDALVAAAESPELALDRQKLDLERAKLLAEMIPSGHFQTQASAEVLYAALSGFGVLPENSNAAMLASEFETARRRGRNQELFLAELLSPQEYWSAEQSDGSVVPATSTEEPPEDDDPFGDDESEGS